MESLADLQGTLQSVGVDTKGFEAFMQRGAEGDQQLAASMREAEEANGCGVPYFVYEDSTTGKRLGLFGREHLALIRLKMHTEGLQRRDDVMPPPEFSFAYRPATTAKL